MLLTGWGCCWRAAADAEHFQAARAQLPVLSAGWMRRLIAYNWYVSFEVLLAMLLAASPTVGSPHALPPG